MRQTTLTGEVAPQDPRGRGIPQGCGHFVNSPHWQNGDRFRRAEPGALPRLPDPGVPRHMPGAGFLATLSNFQNLQITSWCSSLLRVRPHAVDVPKKGMKQEFQLKKSTAKKIREVHSLPQIPHTLEQEERRGASGSSSSITTNFRVSLGSRNRFFRCLWPKQRIFCGLAIIFSWTRGMSSPFSHLSRSVTRSGSSVTRGLFSAWSSSRHDGQPHYGIVQSMSCWWMSFKSFNKSFISKKYRKKFARSTACRRYLTRLSRKMKNGLISDQQFGFLPGRSTLTQLLSVTDEWARAIDRGERVAAVFLDFYKAFDRVWHDGLLHKLGKCGLHPSALAWLQNYLSDRSLSVRVCNATSNPITITAGVPQGSYLGPILFVVFINEITQFSFIKNSFVCRRRPRV